MARLLQAVLARRRVHHEQHFVGRAGNETRSRAAHLVEFVHEAGLGVQAAGGVDVEIVDGARLGGGDGVVEDGRGVAARLVLIISTPEREAQTSSCSMAAARKVSAAQSSTERPCARDQAASLPLEVVLPVPLTPTRKVTFGGACGAATAPAGH